MRGHRPVAANGICIANRFWADPHGHEASLHDFAAFRGRRPGIDAGVDTDLDQAMVRTLAEKTIMPGFSDTQVKSA